MILEVVAAILGRVLMTAGLVLDIYGAVRIFGSWEAIRKLDPNLLPQWRDKSSIIGVRYLIGGFVLQALGTWL